MTMSTRVPAAPYGIPAGTDPGARTLSEHLGETIVAGASAAVGGSYSDGAVGGPPESRFFSFSDGTGGFAATDAACDPVAGSGETAAAPPIDFVDVDVILAGLYHTPGSDLGPAAGPFATWTLLGPETAASAVVTAGPPEFVVAAATVQPSDFTIPGPHVSGAAMPAGAGDGASFTITMSDVAGQPIGVPLSPSD